MSRVVAPLALVIACTPPPAPVAPCPATPPAVAVTPDPVVHVDKAPVAVEPAPAPTVSGYDKPPQNVLDALHAPSPPSPVTSPTHDTILLVQTETYPSITRVAEPYLRLAGVRLEPRTRRKHDTSGGYGVVKCVTGFTLVDVASSRETPVKLPADACVEGVSWTVDGKHFAFHNTGKDAVELWVGDLSGDTHRVGNVKLNPMLGSTSQWLADQKTLLVKILPDNQGAPPAGTAMATGPSVSETDGKSGESSTYETRDTLTDKHDEELFEYYATSQLATIDSATGAVTKIGSPAMIDEVDAAPDGEHILVENIQRPFSYLVTADRFAHDTEVWDRAGHVTKLAQHPLAERVPIHGVPTGPRDYSWRALEPATLIWAEALDNGDWNVNVPARDKIMTQKAPFTSPATELTRTEQRYDGLRWTEQKSIALLREEDENRHWTRTFVIDADDAKAKPAVLWDMSSDEQYKNPGSPIYKPLPNGEWVVRLDGDAIFLAGRGASPEGDRPFLDRLDVKTKKSERLWRSDKVGLESFLAFTTDTKTFLTWHQSPVDPPNAFVHADSGTRQVTHIPDPMPLERAIKKRLVKYKRKDGLELSFTLYTPPDYKEGTRVPAILYAYPLDYASAKQAGQTTGSDQRFEMLRDYRLLLLSGYAIIDNAAFPIVGDPKKAYDTYLTQLVDDAQAAVDKAVELGVVDRDRIGVTGHSHGAMMTANLIAHTDLFRAGAATSGSYNKTLNPFGFQNERRSVWKGTDVYLKVSPFFSADKLKLPLLIVHGAEDANPGTKPVEAVAFYEAIRGNGGTARLVMLPHEPHWYTAMESNEQLAYEELRWFDKYVKNAPAKKKS